MTLEVLVIGVVRILGSLPVLRWALAGGILAILVDLSDLFLMNLLDLGGVPNYQVMDKWLDQVYLGGFLLVALRWRPLLAATGLTLYLYRLVGFAVFEATGERWIIVAFPNVFEFFFIYVAARLWHARRSARRTNLDGPRPPDPAPIGARHLALALPILTLAKVVHEYVIHGTRALDSFTAVEAVQAIWDALRAPF